jgi:hypothetical protein
VDGPSHFERELVSTRIVGQRVGAEKLGASVYELQPGGRQADLHVHYRNEELMAERRPPDPTRRGGHAGRRGKELGRGEEAEILDGAAEEVLAQVEEPRPEG